jgi:hypothetical protein
MTTSSTSTPAITKKEYLKYGDKPKKSGMYLGLLHGRDNPNETMDGWGFDGPSLGPLSWVHTTYAATVRIHFLECADAKPYFGIADDEFELPLKDDLLVFDNQYFGDWTAYFVAPEDCALADDSFRPAKRKNKNWGYHKRLP